MKMKKAKKWVLRVFLFLLSAYFVAVLISGYMMYKTTSIIYNMTNFGITIGSDNIDFETHSAQRNYYNYSGKLTSKENRKLNNGDITRIKTICSFSLLPLWRHSYNNRSIMDGDQWNLIRSTGTVKHKTDGSNAYPLGYKFVTSCINSVFE